LVRNARAGINSSLLRKEVLVLLTGTFACLAMRLFYEIRQDRRAYKAKSREFFRITFEQFR